ncbi:RAP, putative [Babesia ovis]|uniref:RAP, putative n=1 Tax=Babesia ovis TaxID=5869 RepID=A0A9W5TC83_BABOV|nr:RAP, putative [Babesia ovis]
MLRARCISTNVADAATAARCGRQIDPLTESLNQLSFRELLFAAENLAKTRVNDRNLWSKLCDRLRPEIKGNDINQVLRILHALAKVSYKKVGNLEYNIVTTIQISFMNAVERIVLLRHADADPRAVTQYFIDATRLEHIEPNTFQAVIRARVGDLRDFSAFDLCFLLHVAAKLRLADNIIVQAVSREIVDNGDKYETVCRDKALVAMLVRSLAMLQCRNTLFHKIVYSRIPECVDEFSPQEKSNVIFALVVALQDQEYTTEINHIFALLLDTVVDKLQELGNIEVNQLCISLFHLREKLVPFDKRYQALLDDIMGLNLKFKPSTSKMQYKIAPLLDDLKLQHKSEQRVGPYVMDYVIPKLNVAVEVNGYSHFYHQSTEFNAITRLKYKIVNSLGWKVLSVNYFDWKNRSRQSKLEYLAGQLQELVQQ